jgi:hypothetical protein
MINQYSLAPVANLITITLIVVVTLACVLGAVVVYADPLGPGQEQRAVQAKTQLAIAAPATQAAIGATMTPMAMSVRQTAVAGELTAMPPAQTATAMSAAQTHEAVLYGATQTQIADQAYLNGLAIEATTTAVVRNENANTLKSLGGFGLAAMVTFVLCISILGHTAAGLLRANAQQKLVRAHESAVRRDERQVSEFFAAHRKAPAAPLQPHCTSLPEDRRNPGQEMADAEWVERVLAPIMKKENLDYEDDNQE